MTHVSQDYTATLNVSITVNDDGSVRGVTKWQSGNPSSMTERFGSLDYTRPRNQVLKPALTDFQRAVDYAQGICPDSLAVSWIPAIKAVRETFGLGLVEAVDVVNKVRFDKGLGLLGSRAVRFS